VRVRRCEGGGCEGLTHEGPKVRRAKGARGLTQKGPKVRRAEGARGLTREGPKVRGRGCERSDA